MTITVSAYLRLVESLDADQFQLLCHVEQDIRADERAKIGLATAPTVRTSSAGFAGGQPA